MTYGKKDFEFLRNDMQVDGGNIFAIYENGEKKKLCHTDFCVHIGALQSSQTETDLFGNI